MNRIHFDCQSGREYPARRIHWAVAGLLFCQLLLVCGCATVTNRQAAGTDANSGISIVPLVDGGTRVDIATDAAFDYGSDVLRPEFATTLIRVVKPYSRQPLQVSAYTDNVGAPAFNLELSQRRARAVADVLLEQGFNAAQLSVEGYGENHPVASNATERGRRVNRRIELLISATATPDG